MDLNSHKHIDIWEKYQKMSQNNPVKLNTIFNNAKSFTLRTNIRNLESNLDGDWYYLLQNLFGSYIQKIRPGRTRFKSNLNNKNVDISYKTLAHIKCGKNKNSAVGIRISTCIYNNGTELQIPKTEVKNFNLADFYFFEKEGLFLTLNIKKLLNLSLTEKQLIIKKDNSQFENLSLDIINLLKFDCIEHYGYCDGYNITKNYNYEQSYLKHKNGKLITKYKTFPEIWMRGCQSTLKLSKYLAIYISSKKEIWEIIESSTIPGLIENFTDKSGKKLTRQTYEAQIKSNTENLLLNRIPQKLSISYCENKPYFLIKNIFEENKIRDYIIKLYNNMEERKIISGLSEFLYLKNLTKKSMTIHDYYEFIETNYLNLYKNKKSLELKIDILSGNNDSEKNYMDYYLKIKGI
jgi:hypothetical protein